MSIASYRSNGGSNTIALRDDGTVLLWGRNTLGQLGQGDATARTTPVTLAGVPKFVQVAASWNVGFGLSVDGTVWYWGNVEQHENEPDESPTWTPSIPMQMPGLQNIVAISGGGFHMVALDVDGVVWGWGENHAFQIGQNGAPYQSVPYSLEGDLPKVVSISAAALTTLMQVEDGRVFGMGSNVYGALGGAPSDTSVPITELTALSRPLKVMAGDVSLAVVTLAGALRAVGSNGDGLLGDGTTQNRESLVSVLAPDGMTTLDITAPLPPAQPTVVPTLPEWASIAFACLLLFAFLAHSRKRERSL